LEISLISLKIRHKTTYRFNKPVALGPHRLMLRPRENRDLRLISSHVTTTPESVVTWADGYALIAAIAFLCQNATAYQSRKLGLIVGVFHQGPVTSGRVGVG